MTIEQCEVIMKVNRDSASVERCDMFMKRLDVLDGARVCSMRKRDISGSAQIKLAQIKMGRGQ